MSTARSVHGIVNGRWEPSPPRASRVLDLARTGMAKLVKKLSDRALRSSGSWRAQNDVQACDDNKKAPVAAE